ncbi:MAG TPA: leucyl/phenylalanyl-tRNA--protein transferase, partial [Xylella fastidiosa subsp. multiplex]
VRRLITQTELPACWSVLFGEKLSRDLV